MFTQLHAGPYTVSGSSDSTNPIALDHVAPPSEASRSKPRLMGQPANDDPTLMLPICHFKPFDEHLDELFATPTWQKDLEDYFATIFSKAILSECLTDELVTGTLQIVGKPTRRRTRALALTIYMQWMRVQFRFKDTNACGPEIASLISRIAKHLRLVSVYAQDDFLDELNHLCIEELTRMWRWYIAVVFREALPIPRNGLFVRVMAIVAMTGHLFRGGQLRYGVALEGLEYIARSSPWPDALAVIYALLYALGPKLALEQPGWHFIQRLLAGLSPLTVGRIRSDPLCQSVSAIGTLATEWHNKTRVTLYHTCPSNFTLTSDS